MASKKKKPVQLGTPSPEVANAADAAKQKPSDPLEPGKKAARKARADAGVTASGRVRKKATSKPSPAAKKKPEPKKNLKDGLPVDPYDEAWAQEQLNDIGTQEDARIERETGSGLGSGTRGGVGSTIDAIFDLPPRQRATALREAIAGQRAAGLNQNLTEENFADLIGQFENMPDNAQEVLAGLNPDLARESSIAAPEEMDDYTGDYESTGRVSKELEDYGAGFENPEPYGNSDESVSGFGTRANQRPGRASEEDIRRSQVLANQRRQADLDARLSRSVTSSGREIPASLPVTIEEAAARQDYWDPQEDEQGNVISRTTVTTDEPPVDYAPYKDESGTVRQGTVTRPNRGFIVPPSSQDTRRRRQQIELRNLAEGSQALANAIDFDVDEEGNQVPRQPSTVKKTVIKKAPKVSIEPGQEGKIIEESSEDTVTEFPPTTFGDIEGSLTKEQLEAISAMGASPSGLPTQGSRGGFLRHLRRQQVGSGRNNVLSNQLREFSERAGTAADAIVVEPPLDENYDYELAGMGSAKDILDDDQMQKLIEAMKGLTNRKYTPFSAPPRRPTTQRGREAAAGEAQGGIPIGKPQLVQAEEGESLKISKPETQTLPKDAPAGAKGPFADVTSGAGSNLLAALEAQDIANNREPGTSLKNLSERYNLPNISDMSIEDVLSHVESQSGMDPRAVMITPSQQVSRQDASKFKTPEARAARDLAYRTTGGPRGSVRRMTFLRNRAKEIGSGQAGLETVGDTQTTSPKAETIFGANRHTEKQINQEMTDFAGKGGGEVSNAGLLRPGSAATQGRLIVATPKKTWSSSGEVPMSGGVPQLTDDEREKMKLTNPTLESVLNVATGMGRVVARDQAKFDDEGNVVDPGRILRQGQRPVVGKDDTGEPILGEPYTFAHGEPVRNPGTVTNVPVSTPGGQEYGETIVQPMPLHLATQFGLNSEGHSTLPMIAGRQPFKNGDWTSWSSGRGLRTSRILTPEEASDPEKMRRSPAVRRAAGAGRRMAGIQEAKRVSAERKSVQTPEEKAAEELSARRNTRRQQISLAKDVSIANNRAAYESQSPEGQDVIRTNAFIQEPSVERQRSGPGFMRFLGDYARQTGNLYRDNPDYPSTNVNKPGRERAVQMVSQPDDVAGMSRQLLSDAYTDTLRARFGFVPINPKNVLPKSDWTPASEAAPKKFSPDEPPSKLQIYVSNVQQKNKLVGKSVSDEEVVESAYGGNPDLAVSPTPVAPPAMTGSQFNGFQDTFRSPAISNPRTTRVGPRNQR